MKIVTIVILCITCLLLHADINETDPLNLDIALITKQDLRIKGYQIGQDAAREIRRIESSGLMQDQAPVDGTSFCNQVHIEAYSLNAQFTLKLAQEDSNEIFRQGILKGCMDFMYGRTTFYKGKVISSEELDSTDIDSIQRILDKAQGQPSAVNIGKGTDSMDTVLKQVEEDFYINKQRYVK